MEIFFINNSMFVQKLLWISLPKVETLLNSLFLSVSYKKVVIRKINMLILCPLFSLQELIIKRNIALNEEIYLVFIDKVLKKKMDMLVFFTNPCLLCKNWLPKDTLPLIENYSIDLHKVSAYKKRNCLPSAPFIVYFVRTHCQKVYRVFKLL